MNKPELISFTLCPFVQRAVIILLEKQVDFHITYIDLANPPAWFREISPLGKVPLLKTEGEVLFESAIICEYLDETHLPSLHPHSALRRAHNRAWIEFGSELLFAQFRYFSASSQEVMESEQKNVMGKLAMLEGQLGEGPFFNGEAFSLVDAAYAPVFGRFAVIKPHLLEDPWAAYPRLYRWQKHLLARPCVVHSTIPDFATLYQEFLSNKGSLLLAK